MTYWEWCETYRGKIDPRDPIYADLWRVARAPLEARIAELEAALKPFAEWYAKLGEDNISRECVKDYRRAAAALKGGKP